VKTKIKRTTAKENKKKMKEGKNRQLLLI